MATTVGIDLVSVEQIEDSLARHGERYLKRIYTAHERADSRQNPVRLGVRFAAKEATMKALRRADEAIAWTSIEVLRDVDGRPRIELSGGAAELARERGVKSLAVSLTHEAGQAVAVVLAEADGR